MKSETERSHKQYFALQLLCGIGADGVIVRLALYQSNDVELLILSSDLLLHTGTEASRMSLIDINGSLPKVSGWHHGACDPWPKRLLQGANPQANICLSHMILVHKGRC